MDGVAREDTEIATKRLEIVRDFPLLEVTKSVDELASEFMAKSNLSPKASDDAVPIAVAIVCEPILPI